MTDFLDTVYDNGLRVILKRTDTKTVAGRLRIKHGALHEKPGEEGLAHFLEHTLMTCGSKNFTSDTADIVRGTFGYINASTDLTQTLIPVDMLSKDTPLFLDYVADVANNPRFNTTRVEEERNRVLCETADAKSSPTYKDNIAYSEAFFGKNSPHTYFVLGDELVIQNATIKDLANFHQRGYYPNNMDLILVGGLPDDIEEIIEKQFESYSPGEITSLEIPQNPKLLGKKILHEPAPELLNFENPEQSSAHLSMSMTAPTDTDPDSYSVKLLVSILGGDPSSRLFTSVSQRKGLVYSISSQYYGGNNKGGIGITAQLPSPHIDTAIKSIFEEMNNLQSELVSETTLDRVKQNFHYNIIKAYESNAGLVNALEFELDRGFDINTHLKCIDAVTPEQIRGAANMYLQNSDGNYVLGLRDPLKKR